MMVVIPSSIQVFAWTVTVALGRPEFRAPLLFIGGFIVFFVLGGLTGIMFAAIPFDQATTDTYFVVAHFHFIIFGAAVFPILGGMYYWFPKVTGRLYHEGLAKLSFWLTFLGTALTFFPMHIIGLLGMPRRVYTYPSSLGWGAYNLSETIGAFILTAGLLLIFGNLLYSRFRGAPARSEEHTSELQSPCNLVCRLLLEKKKIVEQPHHELSGDRLLRQRPVFRCVERVSAAAAPTRTQPCMSSCPTSSHCAQ